MTTPIKAFKVLIRVIFGNSPKPGEIWVEDPDYPNPFAEKRTVTIFEIRKGWVRYGDKSHFESACPISDFKCCYRRLKEDLQ